MMKTVLDTSIPYWTLPTSLITEVSQEHHVYQRQVQSWDLQRSLILKNYNLNYDLTDCTLRGHKWLFS